MMRLRPFKVIRGASGELQNVIERITFFSSAEVRDCFRR